MEKSIPNYPGYFATSDGEIIRRCGNLLHFGKIPQYKRKDGTLEVKIYQLGEFKFIRKSILVHRLIASAFLFSDQKKTQFVRHKNGIKTDNRVENLEIAPVGLRRSTLNKVKQFTLDGTFVAEFNSLLNAEDMTCICSRSISRVCRGESKSAGNYKWEYSTSKIAEKEEIENWKIIEDFPNYRISKDGKVINVKTRRLLKVYNDKIVKLSYKGKRKTKYIRKLLADAYIPKSV